MCRLAATKGAQYSQLITLSASPSSSPQTIATALDVVRPTPCCSAARRVHLPLECPIPPAALVGCSGRLAGAPCEIFRRYHRSGDPIHSVAKSSAECRPHLPGVSGRIRARQQDVLRESCSAIRQRVKSPLERQCGSIERHLDDERSVRCDGPNVPAKRLLPRKQRRAPRTGREWTFEAELSRRVVPVLHIGPPIPRECWVHLGFN